ncbi:MAG: hypothetical protein DHS20C17_20190 [Cyclobacteriaceae bacterium]|nr:MAG: hypothetical protein DHS20C17_20190 [Cyclobacteriaceae bacterium]
MGFNIETKNFDAVTDSHQLCSNYGLKLCNWLVDPRYGQYCTACSLNRNVPNVNDKENFVKWRHLETAKHRLIYQLHQLNLPLIPRSQDVENGLAFDFLGVINPHNATTGHANGVITIILKEADSVYREQMRKRLSEPYRTLLGHFRHEIGHYYWKLLLKNGDLSGFRELFGDERTNYDNSLQNYYASDTPKDWAQSYITEYATAHPWEDWAETWAHYLHLMDTLETASSLGLSIAPKITQSSYFTMDECQDPYQIRGFKEIFNPNVALTCAANSLSRSMGLPDIYPFIISKPVFTKLKFIHEYLLKIRF